MPDSPIRATAAAIVTCLLLDPAHAAAQDLSRIGVDSAVAIDQFAGQGAVDRPNIIIDVSAVVRLGGGWRTYVRPWIRQPRTAQWNKEIYQALLQYERIGPLSARLDLGYLASPIGLGMMDTRPGVNPTIGGHAAYFSALPTFEAGLPRVEAVGASYPLGGQLTVSASKWDARGAVLSSSPARIFVINRPGNPKPAPTVVGGIGFTPRTGLRVGASLAHGHYAVQDEVQQSFGRDRSVTMGGIEGEFAAGYTKLAGELIVTAYETAGGTATAYTWFAQGTRTLTPRWFVAGRQEGVSAPPAASGRLAGLRSRLLGAEVTAGYRLGTDLTARASVLARKAFTRTDWDQQFGMSLVWARRWW